jgi:hypothetical protein
MSASRGWCFNERVPRPRHLSHALGGDIPDTKPEILDLAVGRCMVKQQLVCAPPDPSSPHQPFHLVHRGKTMR